MNIKVNNWGILILAPRSYASVPFFMFTWGKGWEKGGRGRGGGGQQNVARQCVRYRLIPLRWTSASRHHPKWPIFHLHLLYQLHHARFSSLIYCPHSNWYYISITCILYYVTKEQSICTLKTKQWIIGDDNRLNSVLKSKCTFIPRTDTASTMLLVCEGFGREKQARLMKHIWWLNLP